MKLAYSIVSFFAIGLTLAIFPRKAPRIIDNNSELIIDENLSSLSAEAELASSRLKNQKFLDEDSFIARRYFKRNDHEKQELGIQKTETPSIETSSPPLPQRRKKHRPEASDTLEQKPEVIPRISGKKCHEYPNCRFKIDRPFDPMPMTHEPPHLNPKPDLLVDAYLKYMEKDENEGLTETNWNSGSDGSDTRDSFADQDEGFSEKQHTGPSSVVSEDSSLYLDAEIGVNFDEHTHLESPTSVTSQKKQNYRTQLNGSGTLESKQDMGDPNEENISEWSGKSAGNAISEIHGDEVREDPTGGSLEDLQRLEQWDVLQEVKEHATSTTSDHKSVTFNDIPHIFPHMRLPKTLESNTVMQSVTESSTTSVPPNKNPFEYPSFYDLYEPHRDPHARIVFSDIAAAWRPVEGIITDQEQTAMLLARSVMDGSFAFGVADGFCEEKGLSGYKPQIPQDLTRISKEIYQYSKSSLHASGLLDKAYRRILTHEERVPACISVAFGILDRYGKLSVSAMGRSGAILFRDGVAINETQIRSYQEGQPYIMVPDMRDRVAGSSNPRFVFDMFTEKSDHTWDTHSGDYAIFYTGEVMKHLKPVEIPQILEKNPRATARELAEGLAAKVVGTIKRKQRAARRGRLFACLSKVKPEECDATTDISLVVVKIK